MSDQVTPTSNVTHEEGMDEILDRYERCPRASREKVLLDMKKTSATAVLAPYFEQGKMFERCSRSLRPPPSATNSGT